VVVVDHVGREAESIVLFAEARVVTTTQQAGDRLRMAVGIVQVAEGIKRHPKRVDLPVRPLLDVTSINLKPQCVARLQS